MKPVQRVPQAIILCGGKGTRLSSLYSDRPKILVPIAGRPFLEWQLEWLGQAGVTNIHLAAGFMADVLGGWLEARGQRSEGRGQKERGAQDSTSYGSSFTIRLSRYTFHVSLSSEPAPLGTGGGLKFVEPWLRSDPFLVLNGDSLSPNLDFGAMIETHRDGITIAVARIAEGGRYGTVEFDAHGRITAFLEKAQRESGWINAGVYLIDRAILTSIAPDRNVSIETDVYPDLVRHGRVRACPCPPPMLDMGTPEGIQAMETYLQSAV